jgi:hypothetical protein
MYRCQICKWPVENKIKTIRVAMPEAMSLTIIISLRLERSTSAPAKGEAISIGATKKKPINASAVAELVFSYAQMVMPKPVMLVPSREMIWPIQTMVKPNMPLGRFVSVGVVFITRSSAYYTVKKNTRESVLRVLLFSALHQVMTGFSST